MRALCSRFGSPEPVGTVFTVKPRGLEEQTVYSVEYKGGRELYSGAYLMRGRPAAHAGPRLFELHDPDTRGPKRRAEAAGRRLTARS